MARYPHKLVNLPTELIYKIDAVKGKRSRDGFVRDAVLKEIKHEHNTNTTASERNSEY